MKIEKVEGSGKHGIVEWVKVFVELPIWEKSVQNVYEKESLKLKIKGFRPGKVPYNVGRKYIGEDKLNFETLKKHLDEMIEALGYKEDDVEGIMDFKNEIEDGFMVLSLKLVACPIVEPFQYRNLTIEYKKKDFEEFKKEVLEDYALKASNIITKDEGEVVEENDIIVVVDANEYRPDESNVNNEEEIYMAKSPMKQSFLGKKVGEKVSVVDKDEENSEKSYIITSIGQVIPTTDEEEIANANDFDAYLDLLISIDTQYNAVDDVEKINAIRKHLNDNVKIEIDDSYLDHLIDKDLEKGKILTEEERVQKRIDTLNSLKPLYVNQEITNENSFEPTKDELVSRVVKIMRDDNYPIASSIDESDIMRMLTNDKELLNKLSVMIMVDKIEEMLLADNQFVSIQD